MSRIVGPARVDETEAGLIAHFSDDAISLRRDLRGDLAVRDRLPWGACRLIDRASRRLDVSIEKTREFCRAMPVWDDPGLRSLFEPDIDVILLFLESAWSRIRADGLSELGLAFVQDTDLLPGIAEYFERRFPLETRVRTAPVSSGDARHPGTRVPWVRSIFIPTGIGLGLILGWSLRSYYRPAVSPERDPRTRLRSSDAFPNRSTASDSVSLGAAVMLHGTTRPVPTRRLAGRSLLKSDRRGIAADVATPEPLPGSGRARPSIQALAAVGRVSIRPDRLKNEGHGLSRSGREREAIMTDSVGSAIVPPVESTIAPSIGKGPGAADLMPTPAADRPDLDVIEGKHLRLTQILDRVIAQIGCSYILEPDLDTDLTVRLSLAAPDRALASVLRMAGLSWRVDGRTLYIGTRPWLESVSPKPNASLVVVGPSDLDTETPPDPSDDEVSVTKIGPYRIVTGDAGRIEALLETRGYASLTRIQAIFSPRGDRWSIGSSELSRSGSGSVPDFADGVPGRSLLMAGSPGEVAAALRELESVERDRVGDDSQLASLARRPSN